MIEHNIFVPGYGEKKHKKNQIIIIGAGYIGRQALQYFKQDRVKYFADNSSSKKVGGQAVLGRQDSLTTPWLTERHGYDPTL